MELTGKSESLEKSRFLKALIVFSRLPNSIIEEHTALTNPSVELSGDESRSPFNYQAFSAQAFRKASSLSGSKV